jgi:hypothetical protein
VGGESRRLPIGSSSAKGCGANVGRRANQTVTFGTPNEADIFDLAAHAGYGHHPAPEPFKVDGNLARGLLEIVDTAEGERMRLKVPQHADGLRAVVVIKRPGANAETLPFLPVQDDHDCYMSTLAPAEPHEFDTTLQLAAGGSQEVLPFRFAEPDGHHP